MVWSLPMTAPATSVPLPLNMSAVFSTEGREEPGSRVGPGPTWLLMYRLFITLW
ncbi:hypothetical protein FQZ97_1167740 [compost metagenome]